MPSLSRRRETDVRAGRLESEIRDAEAQQAWAVRRRKGLPYCKHCQKTFEEDSKVCPRCDRKDGMGHIVPIPERHMDEAMRRAVREQRARLGL